MAEIPKTATPRNLGDPINKKESINDNTPKTPPKSSTDKISFAEIFRYTIYCTCFFIVIDNQALVSQSFVANESFINQFTNEIFVDDEIQEINATKKFFPEISTLDDVVNFIELNIIDGIFDEGKGFYDQEGDVEFQYFVILTPLRIIQKRASLTNDPKNLVPYRWADDQTIDNTQSYGPNSTFTYVPPEGGFPLIIPATQLSPDQAREIFRTAIANGFFDNVTKFITIDMGIYNSVQDSITYFASTFTISKSGRVSNSEYILYTRDLVEYESAENMFRAALEIIYLAFFIYYFISEFIKLYNNIKNAILLEKVNGPALFLTEQLAQAAGKSFKTLTTILKAILNHISNIWTFLDVASLVFSLIIIIIWLNTLSKNTINKLIANIPYQAGKLGQDITNDELQSYFSFNEELAQIVDTFSTYYKIAALNALIMTLKLLRYATKYISPLRDMVNILTLAIDKIVMFLIILITVLFAFVFFAHFYYGHVIKDFSTITLTIVYLLGNTDLNFSEIDNMLNYSIPVSFIFNILFMFLINFILCNMFLIYTVDEYRKYMTKKKLYGEEANKKSNVQKREIHPVFQAWFFVKNTVLKRIMKYVWNSRFERYEVEEMKQQKIQERELHLYNNFNFDLNIQDTLSAKENSSTIYNNEANLIKVRARENLKLVILVWKTVGLIGIAMCYIYISLNQQDITQSNLTIQAVESAVESSITLTNTSTASVDLIGIQNSILLQSWLNSTFPGFAVINVYKLQDGLVYNGLFISAYNYLITNEARVTVRFNSYYNNSPEYQKLSLKGVTPSFAADASDPFGEYKDPIVDNNTNTSYYYQADAGYKSKGGYIWTIDAFNWTYQINYLFDTKIWGDSLNTLVIEIPMYQIINQKFVVLTIIFTLNDANAISSQVEVYTVDVHIYDNASSRFRGFLEVCFVVYIVLQIYYISKSIQRKIDNYKTWYSLYVDFFPDVMKNLRELKEPEIIRKLRYVLDFEEVLDIFILIILGFGLAIWLLYILISTTIIVETGNDLSKTIDIDTDSLLSYLETAHSFLNILQVVNSIACIMLCMKVLYYYSFNKSFEVISQTIKRSFSLLPFASAVLLFFFLGYAFFMYWILGPIYPEFSTLSSSFVRMMQVLASFQDFDMNLVKNDASGFLSYLYFLPYVIIINYIIANIFLGVCYDYYTQVKKQIASRSNDQSGIGFKEFFRLSYSLIRRNKANREKMQRVEINDQFLENFDPKKVFEDFRETMSQHGNFKEVKLWVAMCTKNLISEYETRKVIKRMCKEVSLSYINEMNENESYLDNNKNEEDYARKYKEFSLRLKYWNYYRIGSYELLKYMTAFSNKIKQLEELMENPIVLEEKEREKEKIKAYILMLEQEIEKNLQDLNKMRIALNDFNKVKKEESELKKSHH